MPESQILYLLKLVPRILVQTSCILKSALTETTSKGWWGGLQFLAVTPGTGWYAIAITIIHFANSHIALFPTSVPSAEEALRGLSPPWESLSESPSSLHPTPKQPLTPQWSEVPV